LTVGVNNLSKEKVATKQTQSTEVPSESITEEETEKNELIQPTQPILEPLRRTTQQLPEKRRAARTDETLPQGEPNPPAF
jgi:hypothetical protein